MPKFAHMSDIHIGAFRQPELRALVLKAFDAAIDRCIEAEVEFVIMAGDIFDSNIPDLSSVKHAAARIREAKDKGIRFYVVYGSHDFSPNYSSIVDVLESAGLLTKLEKVTQRGDGRLDLAMTRDPSGVKLCGISGKKLGLDRLDYELLDTGKLEREEGFRVFVFHGALEELKPGDLSKVEAMSISRLPKGFAYYAGGHIHQRSVSSIGEWRNVAYPGPLFGTDFRDLEAAAKGVETGFYIVDFDTRVREAQFVPTTPCDVVEMEVSAQGRSASQVSAELQSLAREGGKVEGRLVLLRVHGELSEGKTSDIDFGAVRRQLLTRRPISLLLSYSQLTTREQTAVAGQPKSQSMTEKETFEQRISQFKGPEPRLRGEGGVQLSLGLLKVLKEEKRENELKGDYQSRMEKAGADALGLGERKR